MTVGVVGEGPGAAAVEAAVADTPHDAARIVPGDIASVTLAVVLAPAGDDAFVAAQSAAVDPWVAVEYGGLGGYPVDGLDAAVSLLDPAGPCFACLRRRVAAIDAADAAAGRSVDPGDKRLAGAHAGHLAAGLLAGDVAPGRIVELPHADRRLLPAPGCSCGGTPAAALPRGDEAPVGVEAAVDRADPGIDGRVGIVPEVGEAHSFPAPYYLARLCDTTAFGDGEAARHAAGVAADWDAAFMKAVGEAFERYSAATYRREGFVTAAARGLEDAVPLARFVRPADGYETPEPGEPIEWVAGETLRGGEPVHLPAEFVCFPPPERRFAPSITTGLGLGATPAAAVESGLSEVVERDAVTIAWYSTFDPIALDVTDEGFRTLVRRARAEDLAVTPLLVTQDVDVPVVVCCVHRDGEWPRFAAGSACDLDAGAAARGALAEALQSWMELRGMGEDAAAETEPTLARYAAFPREARAFLDVDGRVDAATLGADAGTGWDRVGALLDRVEAAGLEAYVARRTPRDVAALGFEAVRVLVPAAQPLFVDPADRFFGDRARSVPRDLGFRPRFDRPPHPYP